MTNAEIKNIENPIDAKTVIMTGAKLKKLPAHIYTDSLTIEKSTITKLNTDLRANVLNIRNTKLEQLPKDFRVNSLIVDAKTAKNLSLSILRQCGSIDMDGVVYSQNSVNGFNFCSVTSEANENCMCGV